MPEVIDHYRDARMAQLGDSLAFHGPEQPELLTHPDLYPNVLAADLDAEVDVRALTLRHRRDLLCHDKEQ